MSIVSPEIESYLDTLISPADAVQREMEQIAAQRSFPIVGPLVGQLLSVLARSCGARRVLELGSGFGYSALWFARALGPGGEIHCTDSSEENCDLALRLLEQAGYGRMVRFHLGDALEVLADVDVTFDVIFNDIDKEKYPEVVEPVVTHLRRGGLFITDNVLWRGQVARPDPDETTAAVLEFNRRLHAHPALEASVLPLRDGVAVAVKR